MQTNTVFTKQLGIDARNLEKRLEFIRLGEAERKILTGLLPWAEKNAPVIAKAFYDWQFAFTRTLAFFQNYAREKGYSLETMRGHLESAQAGYYVSVFTGARDGWPTDYFEGRLKVGWIHDQINLPFKWYIGSYSEYQRLTGVYLRKSFKDAAFVLKAEEAISRAFNLDMQAISDSFLFNTFESMGLSVEAVKKRATPIAPNTSTR